MKKVSKNNPALWLNDRLINCLCRPVVETSDDEDESRSDGVISELELEIMMDDAYNTSSFGIDHGPDCERDVNRGGCHEDCTCGYDAAIPTFEEFVDAHRVEAAKRMNGAPMARREG